ncbi:uncharacterized protein LOC125830664 [Solanum verrucosum]|uniref:uncharacterized protein LOC125830664 n=1 Tax=Solanum verrucosum TaxID=315347 RepID=UPI0020D0208B|nr:uncharacterized protein LOC125830664 [Solanum verrucosum]
MEKDTQMKEDASINAQLQGLRKALKILQVTRGTESLDYDDLCIHPDIDMPVGYKPPKFDMFDGKGDNHAHLRAYCDKLVGVGRNEKLRMKLFIRSLSREALTWVQPPLDESELSKHFIRAQESVYFDKIMSMMGQKFAELVKMGDFIEEGVKFGKIQSIVALQAASRAIQLGSIGGIKNKRENVSVVTFQQGGSSHRYPNNPQIVVHASYVPYPVYNTQPHNSPPRTPAYQNPPRPYVPVQAPIHQNRPAYAPRPRPNLEARNARTYTPIVEPYAQLFEWLRTVGVLQPIEGKLSDPIPRNFDGNKRCSYHSRIQGHDTEDCYRLKNQIESLIRRGVINALQHLPI